MEKYNSNNNPKDYTFSDDIQTTDESELLAALKEEEEKPGSISKIKEFRRNLESANHYNNAMYAFCLAGTLFTLASITAFALGADLTKTFVDEAKYLSESDMDRAVLKNILSNLSPVVITGITGAALSWAAAIRSGVKANKLYKKVEEMEQEKQDLLDSGRTIDYLKMNYEISKELDSGSQRGREARNV